MGSEPLSSENTSQNYVTQPLWNVISGTFKWDLKYFYPSIISKRKMALQVELIDEFSFDMGNKIEIVMLFFG